MKKDKIKKKFQMKMSRRQVLKAGLFAGAGMMVPWRFRVPIANAATQGPGLSNPADQPKFTEIVPNALDPAFIYNPRRSALEIGVAPTTQMTGLVGPDGTTPVPTPLWGYGDVRDDIYTWPGRTFVAKSGVPLSVTWENKLLMTARGGPQPVPFLIRGKDNSSLYMDNPNYDFRERSVLDESLHWAYSLHGYESYSIEKDGVPIVPHVHGGHTDFQYDGNPEFFFAPMWAVQGPQWVTKDYIYDNSQPAATNWYHDHALGITRLNVYAGMAGFYIIRDNYDTGRKNNSLYLPAYPYEAAFAIQDRMFKDNGELFYPAFPGDPFYADFITGEGADLSSFENGGPTGLAEFFGDHMVVNGKIWPKMDVERRNYRLRFLNGCDSRFLVVQFWKVPAGATNIDETRGDYQLDFTVIGSDQGLASAPNDVDTLVMETGSRYDVIVDFNQVLENERVIMKNIGWDTPFGFDYGGTPTPGDEVFIDRQTDRIMAFDVNLPFSNGAPDPTPNATDMAAYGLFRHDNYGGYNLDGDPDRVRKVALFEGTDEYGRLQPILGTAEPATDYEGNDIDWPSTAEYIAAGLTGQMEGATAWHSPTTENPALGDIETWQVYNVTGDSHPIHLHLVHFEVLERREIVWDSGTVSEGDMIPDGMDGMREATEDDVDRVIPNVKTPAVPVTPDGTYLVTQPVIQHNSTTDPATWGNGFRVVNPTYNEVATVDPGPEYVDSNSPKDMVTARPDEVTFIKCKFDKPGRYVWHCHILSHEDHEMMRVLYVGDGTEAQINRHPAPAY